MSFITFKHNGKIKAQTQRAFRVNFRWVYFSTNRLHNQVVIVYSLY